MAITVQMQFESAVTEMYQDAFVGSSIEDGATIITFDLRQHALPPDVGTTSTLSWRKEAYQTPPRHPGHQWELKLTGSSRENPRLAAPVFPSRICSCTTSCSVF